jgi:uncharacterized membrane protein (Fun14 family)
MLASRPVLRDLPIHLTLSSSFNHVICMIINYSLHGYIRTCLLHLGIFFYSLFSLLSLRLAQVCVHYPEYTIFTPAMNYWLTMQVCNLVHIYARLLTPCPPLGKYK